MVAGSAKVFAQDIKLLSVDNQTVVAMDEDNDGIKVRKTSIIIQNALVCQHDYDGGRTKLRLL